MAKSNAKNVKKKVSSYDDKLIKIIGASLTGVVALIVVILLVVSYSTSYICKVGGERVMTYEYQLFLGTTMEQMEADAEDALGEDEEFDAVAFWTDEKIAEAQEKALEDVKEWKANYIIAKKEGYGLSWSEKNEYVANLQANVEYAYQYQAYYYGVEMTYDEFIYSYLGGMTFNEYKEYALQEQVISEFRTALENGYEVTDEQLQTKFDEDPDTYRKIILYTYAVEKPAEPEKELGEEPVLEEGIEEGSTEYAVYEAELKEYNELKAEWDAYKDELADLEEKVEEIYKSLYATGKYSGFGVAEVTDSATATATEATTATTVTATPEATAEPEVTENPDATAESDSAESDEAAEATPEATATAEVKYNEFSDAVLSELAAQEGALFADTYGKHEFDITSETDGLILDDYALSLNWENDDRLAIISTSDIESFATESEIDESKEYSEGKVSTKPVLLSDDTYFYITQCVGIKDLVTNAEPWASDETDDDGNAVMEDTCVSDTVKSAVLSDMSDAEFKSLREGEYSNKVAVKSKKQKAIDKIVEEVSVQFKTTSAAS